MPGADSCERIHDVSSETHEIGRSELWTIWLGATANGGWGGPDSLSLQAPGSRRLG